MFLLGALIPFMFFTCEGEGKIIGSRDTIVSQGLPIINNYSFTKPTVYKERTIVYDSTRPNEVLTRKDSDLIVFDYLKRRYYADSILNPDSSKFFYWATVEKNTLSNMRIQSKYRPKILTVNNYIEPGNALLFGADINYRYEAMVPSVAAWAAFENKKYFYGIRYDYFNKQAAVLIGRRLQFKGKTHRRRASNKATQ